MEIYSLNITVSGVNFLSQSFVDNSRFVNNSQNSREKTCMLESLFKYSLEEDLQRCSSKQLFLKSLQISQGSTCTGVFFIKVAGPQNCNFIKKRHQYRFFPVKIAKNFMNILFYRTSPVASSTISGFQPASLLKKRLRESCFFVTFANILRISSSFDRTPPGDCFLCLFVNFEKFFRTILLSSTSGKLLISCRSCRISTTRYNEKYFTGAFQAF